MTLGLLTYKLRRFPLHPWTMHCELPLHSRQFLPTARGGNESNDLIFGNEQGVHQGMEETRWRLYYSPIARFNDLEWASKLKMTVMATCRTMSIRSCPPPSHSPHSRSRTGGYNMMMCMHGSSCRPLAMHACI